MEGDGAFGEHLKVAVAEEQAVAAEYIDRGCLLPHRSSRAQAPLAIIQNHRSGQMEAGSAPPLDSCTSSVSRLRTPFSRPSCYPGLSAQCWGRALCAFR